MSLEAQREVLSTDRNKVWNFSKVKCNTKFAMSNDCRAHLWEIPLGVGQCSASRGRKVFQTPCWRTVATAFGAGVCIREKCVCVCVCVSLSLSFSLSHYLTLSFSLSLCVCVCVCVCVFKLFVAWRSTKGQREVPKDTHIHTQHTTHTQSSTHTHIHIHIHTWNIQTWHDSFRHNAFTYASWLIHTCNMTHSQFTWLIEHSNVTLLAHVCDVTHAYIYG